MTDSVMAALYNKYQGSESKGQRRGGRERDEAWRNRLAARPYRKEWKVFG